MIETLSLANFKGFQKLDSLAMKPVTILCGTNSSGKSSILQSMLLLKQTLESQTPNQTLLFNGRFVHLGAFEDVIFGRDSERRLGFELTFRVGAADREIGPQVRRMPVEFLIRELLGSSRPDIGTEVIVTYKIYVKTLRQSASDTQLAALQVDSFELSFYAPSAIGQEQEISSLKFSHLQEDDFELTWNNIRIDRHAKRSTPPSGTLRAGFSFTNFSPWGIVAEAPDPDTFPYYIMQSVYYAYELMKSVFASYTYLGPLREEPLRRYIYEDEVVEMGTKGENAPYIYLAEQYRHLRNEYFYDPNSETFSSDNFVQLGPAVERWLHLMNIPKLKPERTREIIYVHLNAGASRTTRVNIADVGFGVSQIFPIILEGLRMPKRGTLLLEQPEIHLHPNMQMQLADYFIALALSDKNVVVETHSDHVVNRLIRRIIEDGSGKLQDLVAIYFISNEDSGSVYEAVRVDPRRGIVNWPTGFFDQSATEQEKILRAGLRKRQAELSPKR